MLTKGLAAVLLMTVLAVPASAHTAIYSEDDRVRGSAGLLNEPTSTYAVTGLDLCFTQNTTATPRPPIAGINAGALTVILKAPNGETFTTPLSVGRAERAHCVGFANPLVLTQPGQYLLDISGQINGTSFSVTNVAAGGAVRDRAEITFPDEDVIADHDAQKRIADLEAEVDALRSEMAAMHASMGSQTRDAPSLAMPLLMLGLVALALVLRRK